jgi:hypothetical protein
MLTTLRILYKRYVFIGVGASCLQVERSVGPLDAWNVLADASLAGIGGGGRQGRRASEGNRRYYHFKKFNFCYAFELNPCRRAGTRRHQPKSSRKLPFRGFGNETNLESYYGDCTSALRLHSTAFQHWD